MCGIHARRRSLCLCTQDAGIVYGSAVEIGPEKHNTVLEVAELVKELTGSSSEIVHLPMRPGEVSGAVVAADTSTLALVGMSSDHLVPLRVGMQHTIEYFERKNRLEHYRSDRCDDEDREGLLVRSLSGSKVSEDRDQPTM